LTPGLLADEEAGRWLGLQGKISGSANKISHSELFG
jgi:hypothetical protein